VNAPRLSADPPNELDSVIHPVWLPLPSTNSVT